MQASYGLHVPVQRHQLGQTGAHGRHVVGVPGSRLPGDQVALLGQKLDPRPDFRAGQHRGPVRVSSRDDGRRRLASADGLHLANLEIEKCNNAGHSRQPLLQVRLHADEKQLQPHLFRRHFPGLRRSRLFVGRIALSSARRRSRHFLLLHRYSIRFFLQEMATNAQYSFFCGKLQSTLNTYLLFF